GRLPHHAAIRLQECPGRSPRPGALVRPGHRAGHSLSLLRRLFRGSILHDFEDVAFTVPRHHDPPIWLVMKFLPEPGIFLLQDVAVLLDIAGRESKAGSVANDLVSLLEREHGAARLELGVIRGLKLERQPENGPVKLDGTLHVRHADENYSNFLVHRRGDHTRFRAPGKFG